MKVEVKEDCTYVIGGETRRYSAGRQYTVPLDVAREMERSGKGKLLRISSGPAAIPAPENVAGPSETKPAQVPERKQRPTVEDISSMNVEQVLKSVRDGTYSAQAVLEAERMGQHRKTVISALEGREEE